MGCASSTGNTPSPREEQHSAKKTPDLTRQVPATLPAAGAKNGSSDTTNDGSFSHSVYDEDKDESSNPQKVEQYLSEIARVRGQIEKVPDLRTSQKRCSNRRRVATDLMSSKWQ